MKLYDLLHCNKLVKTTNASRETPNQVSSFDVEWENKYQTEFKKYYFWLLNREPYVSLCITLIELNMFFYR